VEEKLWKGNFEQAADLTTDIYFHINVLWEQEVLHVLLYMCQTCYCPRTRGFRLPVRANVAFLVGTRRSYRNYY
jgi:hypothetical protein